MAFCSGERYCDAREPLTLRSVSSFHTGLFEKSAAEIPAYCSQTQRLFVVNATSGQVDVFSIDPSGGLSRAGVINAATNLGVETADVNSVSVSSGTVAVAVAAAVPTDAGAVAFFDTATLAPKGSAAAGALPDMVTFTPDGRFVLVANEGEPNEDYTVDPEGTVTIIDVQNGFEDPVIKTVTFRDWNPGGQRVDEVPGLKQRGLRLFGQIRVDAEGKQTRPATFAEDVEPEWIAVDPESRLAYVCLQEANAVAEIDIIAAKAKRIIPLGFKNHGRAGNELDVSDEDDGVAIRAWPGLFGVYQPDAIRLFRHDNRLLLVTANEGDSRLRPTYDGAIAGVNEGDFFSDEASVKDWPVEGTPFAESTSKAKLGRLRLVRDLVDRHLDDQGRPTRLYSFGGRSFSIFDLASETCVFDSGADFEKVTAQRFPRYFNVSNDSLKREKRSRSKGPEPEALTLGEIAGRTYAFIGLERIGGIMVYDITVPGESQAVGYFTNRRFDVPATLPDGASNPEAGDSGPEGLIFVAAEQSPTGTNLLIAANETSGTTTVWEIVVGP